MECTPRAVMIENPGPQPVVDEIENDSFEDHLFEPKHEVFPSIKNLWPNIILPSHSSSMRLVEFDRIWNSWVHAALDHPLFETEHIEFLSKIEDGASINEIDPLWLALYFSVIAVSLIICVLRSIQKADNSKTRLHC